MFCSTVIPTVGRSTLSRAVESVLDQSLAADGFEVIVVNDSGRSLPIDDWQSSPHVRIVEANRRERSVARNSGAATARGRYIHFLDDDDWLLPGALQELWNRAQASSAAYVYGGTQLVDTSDHPLLQLHHGLEGNVFTPLMAGEWIPLQSSLIQSDAFFDVGGFHPLLAAAEDIDLSRRLALRGDFAETPALISCVRMRASDTTTDYGKHAEASR